LRRRFKERCPNRGEFRDDVHDFCGNRRFKRITGARYIDAGHDSHGFCHRVNGDSKFNCSRRRVARTRSVVRAAWFERLRDRNRCCARCHLLAELYDARR
jgi:hypothetical protein